MGQHEIYRLTSPAVICNSRVNWFGRVIYKILMHRGLTRVREDSLGPDASLTTVALNCSVHLCTFSQIIALV